MPSRLIPLHLKHWWWAYRIFQKYNFYVTKCKCLYILYFLMLRFCYESCTSERVITNTSCLSLWKHASDQPTKKLTEGGVSREQQDDVVCSVQPFLRTKRVAGIRKQCLKNCNWGVLTLTVLLSWLKALTCSDWGPLLLGLPPGNLSFAKTTLVEWISEEWTQKG
jgi:hypothetical protein